MLSAFDLLVDNLLALICKLHLLLTHTLSVLCSLDLLANWPGFNCSDPQFHSASSL